MAPVNSMGAFPSYNATKGVLQGWEKVSGEALAKVIQERKGNPTHMGCSQCIIHCSNVYHDKEGRYLTGSLEYETIWSRGGMTGITDLDTIARLDFLCDDIGVDTMSTGVAVAVAMDAGHARFGTSLGPDSVPALGMKVIQAEREFNRQAGFTSKDDRLPEFFYKEPLPPHNKVFLVSDEDIDRTFEF